MKKADITLGQLYWVQDRARVRKMRAVRFDRGSRGKSAIVFSEAVEARRYNDDGTANTEIETREIVVSGNQVYAKVEPDDG